MTFFVRRLKTWNSRRFWFLGDINDGKNFLVILSYLMMLIDIGILKTLDLWLDHCFQPSNNSTIPSRPPRWLFIKHLFLLDVRPRTVPAFRRGRRTRWFTQDQLEHDRRPWLRNGYRGRGYTTPRYAEHVRPARLFRLFSRASDSEPIEYSYYLAVRFSAGPKRCVLGGERFAWKTAACTIRIK